MPFCVVYDHPWWPERTGNRQTVEGPGDEPEGPWIKYEVQELSDAICEPLGRYYDLLVKDQAGVHWWGYGFPDLHEHPDFSRDACFACGFVPRPVGVCPQCHIDSRFLPPQVPGPEHT